MSTNVESKNIHQLLAEADELIQQIDSDAIMDMEEEHRLEIEKHAQNYKRIKSEIHEKLGNEGASEISASASGMHEAILNIVKAMKDLKKYLS